MDKLSRYYGIIIFAIIVVASLYYAYNSVSTSVTELLSAKDKTEKLQQNLTNKEREKAKLESTLRQLKSAATNVQKKIYSPVDSDLGDDTLFFTMYTDVIEMIHSNSIKIKSMKYNYNPEEDPFVKAGNGTYFVCDVNMELVSNYTNLGKLIQDIYQYPYYIRINNLEVSPYPNDKKILISNISLRLYARTSPEETPTVSDGN